MRGPRSGEDHLWESTKQWSCSVMLQEKTQGTAGRAGGCCNPEIREYIRGAGLNFAVHTGKSE